MKKYWYFILVLVAVSIIVLYDRLYWGMSSPVPVFTGENSFLNNQKEEDLHVDFQFPWQKNNLVSSEKPNYYSKTSYHEILSDPEWTHTGEVSRYYDKENDQRIAKVKGYAHYFTFPGFGIVVGTDNPYDDEFATKNPEIFRRYQDDSYDVVYTMNKFYIQRFQKDLNKKFDRDLLNQQNAVSGCVFSLYDDTSYGNPLNIPKGYVIYSLDFSEDNSFCEQNTNNVIYFVYNPKRSNTYYKLSWEDGCAPSCGVPESFEILPN